MTHITTDEFLDKLQVVPPGETFIYFIGRLAERADVDKEVAQLRDLVRLHGTDKNRIANPTSTSSSVKPDSTMGFATVYLTQKGLGNGISEYRATMRG